jgi:hypothetical protein
MSSHRALDGPASLLNQAVVSPRQEVRYDVYSHPDQRRIRYHYRGRCAILLPLPSPFLTERTSAGGAAGCIVAGRLATADPNLRVLVLEAGPPTYNNPAHRQPARFLSHIAPGSRTVRMHESRPSAALGDRSTIVPCGQCLGGGGSVNCKFVFLYFSGGREMEKMANCHWGYMHDCDVLFAAAVRFHHN